MEGVEAFLFFLALRGEAKREEVRARFPRLVPLLKALGEAVEVQGETFRLAKPLRLSWFAPLFRARYSPLRPEEERALALERLVEAAFRSAEAAMSGSEPRTTSLGSISAGSCSEGRATSRRRSVSAAARLTSASTWLR